MFDSTFVSRVVIFISLTYIIWSKCLSNCELVKRSFFFNAIMEFRRSYSWFDRLYLEKSRGLFKMLEIVCSSLFSFSSKRAEPVRREKRMWPMLQISARWSYELFSYNCSGAMYGRLPQKCCSLSSTWALQENPKSASLTSVTSPSSST